MSLLETMAMMMEALRHLGLHLAVMKALLRYLARLICWALAEIFTHRLG